MLKRFLCFFMSLVLIAPCVFVYATQDIIHTLDGDTLTVNSWDYCSYEGGEIKKITEGWIGGKQDLGNYILTSEHGVWNAIYKIYIPEENVGEFDVYTVAGHWRSDMPLGITFDDVFIGSVLMRTDSCEPIYIGKFELSAGEHTIKIDGMGNVDGFCASGCYYKEITFKKILIPTDGDPYDGIPFSIGEGTSVLYAAKKNKNAVCTGGTVWDFWSGLKDINIEDTKIENTSIMGTSVNEYWNYTVDVEKSGYYKIEALVSGGYSNVASTENDSGGRVTVDIGNTNVVSSDFVLPSAHISKSWYQFTDEDRADFGMHYLNEGVQIMKVAVSTMPREGQPDFRKFWFTEVSEINEIIIEEQSIILEKGDKKELTYKVLPDNAKIGEVVWESSNPEICSVTDGVVEALQKGEAVISVKMKSFPENAYVVAKCDVKVQVLADEITFDKENISMKVGDTVTITATVIPEDTSDKTLFWQSSNREVASVEAGVIKAKAAGTAKITAICGNISKDITVTVTGKASAGGGGGGSSGGGGGGGQKYVSATVNDKQSVSDNEISVTTEVIPETDIKKMQEIFEDNDTLKYTSVNNKVSNEISGEFFIKNPGTKSIVYDLKNITVELGADILNKEEIKENSKVKVELDFKDNCFRLSVTIDGKEASSLNGGVTVKLAADLSKDYTVMCNGKEIRNEIKDSYLLFAAENNGSYEISEKDFTYADADALTWAKDDIYSAVKSGFLKPESKNKFGADSDITRGELLYAVVKAIGLLGDIKEGFEDVPETNEFYREISIAKSLGIVNGVDGKNFLPGTPVTRQDMAKILCIAMEMKGNLSDIEAAEFSDDELIADYAKGAVYKLSANGILKGSDAGFEPLENTTKAETAVLIARIININ